MYGLFFVISISETMLIISLGKTCMYFQGNGGLCGRHSEFPRGRSIPKDAHDACTDRTEPEKKLTANRLGPPKYYQSNLGTERLQQDRITRGKKILIRYNSFIGLKRSLKISSRTYKLVLNWQGYGQIHRILSKLSMYLNYFLNPPIFQEYYCSFPQLKGNIYVNWSTVS